MQEFVYKIKNVTPRIAIHTFTYAFCNKKQKSLYFELRPLHNKYKTTE